MTITMTIDNMYLPTRTWRFEGVHGWLWDVQWIRGADFYPIIHEADGNIVRGELER